MKLLASPPALSFCILLVVLFSSSICLVNGVLVAKTTANDWATGLVRFQRTVGTSTTFRVIYLTSSNSLQISPIVTNQVCIDTTVGCASPTTLGNAEADYITAAGESAVYYREKTTGVLKKTLFTGASTITMPSSALSTSINSQFFYSTTPTVLYRNADGSLYYASGAGVLLDTVSVVTAADAYPLPPNARPPFSSVGVDIYWKEGTTLYYERVGGISKSVNITHASAVTAFGNLRFFSPATTKYYLVQATAGGLNYLWLAVPNDPDNPILISGNQYTVKADDYLITAGTNLVVFIARTDNVDNNLYLWKFPLASATSASPTQISTSNSGFTGLLAFSSGDRVVVRSGTSLFVIDTNVDTTVTMTGLTVGTNSVYAPFASDRVVVLLDGSTAAGSDLNIYNAGTGALIVTIASNVNSFIAGPNGINIVYLISNAAGGPGLYRATYSAPGTSVQLTPSTLTAASAQTISYAISHDSNRVLYHQDNDLYLVPIIGCTYVAITTQPSAPSAQNSCPGDSVTLTVAATGSNLVYQWQVNTGSWGNVASGGTSSSLTVTVGASPTSYRVIVGGDCGGVVSNTVIVTPTGDGTITTQPSFSSPVCASATQVSLSVTAGIPSSTTATYAWRKTGSSTVLSTTAGYAFTRSAGNSGTYTCTIQFACNSLTTNPLSIVINPTTQITTQTSDSLVCENKGNFTFSITTVGVGLSYQWFKNGTAITGATSSSLTVGNPLTPLVNQPTVYEVDVTGTCGGASSTPSVLQVLPGSTPSITFQPLTKQVCLGTKLRFHVEATGVALNYEWYFGTTRLSETSDSLVIQSANSSHAGDYYCIVRTSNCTLTPSQLASLAVITTCKNTTNTVVFYIGSQSVQSFNDSYRDTVFLPGIVAILAELGITITADQIVITSLKDGSVYVEFGVTGPNGSLAIQALLDIWNLETTDILPRNGLTTVRNIFAGSATVVTPPNNNGDGGDGGSDNTGAIVGGVIGGIFGCALLVICLIMVVLLIVFIVRKGGLPLSKGVGGKKWQQSNWWEEDDM